MRKLSIITKIILLLIIFSIIFVPTTSKANDFEDIFSQGQKWIQDGKNSNLTYMGEGGTQIEYSQSELNDIANNIFNILVVIGTALVVIIGGVLGIKYMMASAEDKARIKETLVPYVAGSVVIFGAFGIWKLTATVLDSISSEVSVQEVKEGLANGDMTIQDLNQLSNDQIREYYETVYNSIVANMDYTIADIDARLNNAVNDLSEQYRQIYLVAKNKGLLASDGYSLKE